MTYLEAMRRASRQGRKIVVITRYKIKHGERAGEWDYGIHAWPVKNVEVVAIPD